MRLALLFTLLLTAPAAAQVPCGVVDPCPTVTPSPTPTASPSPSPTPTPVVPVRITLRRLPKLAVTGTVLHVRGRITGIAPSGSDDFELVRSVPAYHRQLPVESFALSTGGTFDVAVDHDVTTRYTVRARPGGPASGTSATRTVRAEARYDLTGGFDQIRPVFAAVFTVVTPKLLFFSDGKSRTGPPPRRAFFYAGRGRHLRRIGSARFREDGFDGEDETATRVAALHVRATRLPLGRFHYAACFPGRGARGLVPGFTNCGAKIYVR